MLSVDDVHWHHTWILTKKNNRISAGRAAKALFGGKVTVSVAPLQVGTCQHRGVGLVTAPFHLAMRQEEVDTRWSPRLILSKLHQRCPFVYQVSYLAWNARIGNNGRRQQCKEENRKILDLHST